jgi:hypothetical protein
MRRSLVSGNQTLSPFSVATGMGVRMGGGLPGQMLGEGQMSVMPPSFGYPFYQPPSLLISP